MTQVDLEKAMEMVVANQKGSKDLKARVYTTEGHETDNLYNVMLYLLFQFDDGRAIYIREDPKTKKLTLICFEK